MPKAKAKKKSPEERALARKQRSHLAIVRNALQNMGFVRFPDISDSAITFKGTTSDFDDLFIWENVLLLLGYTVSSNNISEHVKKKEFLYSKIRSDKDGFLDYLIGKFPL